LIIESIFNLLFGLVNIIISLLPTLPQMPSFLSNTIDLLKIPLSIFPLDLWIAIITNLSVWFVAQNGWAIVEWVYKKIPGVD